MSYNKNRSVKMRDLEDKELLQIIEDGTLRHAAARKELRSRGREILISAVDAEFRRQHC